MPRRLLVITGDGAQLCFFLARSSHHPLQIFVVDLMSPTNHDEAAAGDKRQESSLAAGADQAAASSRDVEGSVRPVHSSASGPLTNGNPSQFAANKTPSANFDAIARQRAISGHRRAGEWALYQNWIYQNGGYDHCGKSSAS